MTIIIALAALVAFFVYFSKYKKTDKMLKGYEEKVSETVSENLALKERLDSIGAADYFEAAKKTSELRVEADELNIKAVSLRADIDSLQKQSERLEKNIKTQTNKLARSKELAAAVNYAIDEFFYADINASKLKLTAEALGDIEELSPSIILKLHYMDMKDLRKAYRDNDKQISQLTKQYESRYTTKANQTIYRLMVIALRAELQNILYQMKYEKLDKAIEDVRDVTRKYLDIASAGNQSIAGTMTKFIGELEYLFTNAVKIEYNYYVKKEQARQEQLAIREQMRQEAEERKALEREKKKIAEEESKYEGEIEKLKTALSAADSSESDALKARIAELEAQLSDVIIKKDEIVKLANGKAGNVYIISNLGAFGEDVFKIGMTRRLNPQDRVDELGSASVPFRFDVHSFIFSDDAVKLESELHSRLNNKRVNKVNLRKEFFRVSIDELEELVNQIDPTADFSRTMMAEEYRQSESSDEVYTASYDPDEEEDSE